MTLIFLDSECLCLYNTVSGRFSGGPSTKKVSDPLLGYEVDYPYSPMRSNHWRQAGSKYVALSNPPTVQKFKEFVLSAFAGELLFCGGAGPGTVLRSGGIGPVTSERNWAGGRFRPNSADLNHLMFQLEDAILVSPWSLLRVCWLWICLHQNPMQKIIIE